MLLFGKTLKISFTNSFNLHKISQYNQRILNPRLLSHKIACQMKSVNIVERNTKKKYYMLKQKQSYKIYN
jgi:hypothetical protein